jgi:hypothetical protein
MQFNKHINIRISDEQLKILMSAVINEKTTLSTLVRNIINGYELEEPKSFGKKVNDKSKN